MTGRRETSIVTEEVHFWPSNYCRSLVLTIEPENQESLAIELLKSFNFGHPAVLQSRFADVAASWRWAHISSPCLLPLLSSSLSSLSSAGVLTKVIEPAWQALACPRSPGDQFSMPEDTNI
jgi:hypothetical protein